MFTFKKMRLHYAKQIASWKYDGYMKDIYMKPYFDHYNEQTGEMRGPLDCDGFAVFEGQKLMGLFEYYQKEEGIEIGLAIHPDYVGKGYSSFFIKEGIQHAISFFHYTKPYIYLAVDKENIAAYKAYQKCGFEVYEITDDEIKMRYNIKEM